MKKNLDGLNIQSKGLRTAFTLNYNKIEDGLAKDVNDLRECMFLKYSLFIS